MKQNMSTVDRLIRIVIAIIISVLVFGGVIKGTLGILLLIFAGLMVITGFLKFCLVYSIFGIKTCKDDNTK